MENIRCQRLTDEMLPAFLSFCREHWGEEHPLIHRPEVFDRYYRRGSEINFLVALKETEGAEKDASPSEILGAAGFLVTGEAQHPDVFLSFLLSARGAPFGISLRLIEQIKALTGARTIACNNIRRKTRGIYEFLGYRVADMRQWYRLNPALEHYHLVVPGKETMPPIASDSLSWNECKAEADLARFPFADYRQQRPYKDRAYFAWRFFDDPWNRYRVFLLNRGNDRALLVVRVIRSGDAAALRVVDFFGDTRLIGETGLLLTHLLMESGSEFVDWYEFGADAALLTRAGLTLRKEGGAVVPLYLTPPLMQNTDITVFVSDPAGYQMFRADGDQDRPNFDEKE